MLEDYFKDFMQFFFPVAYDALMLRMCLLNP